MRNALPGIMRLAADNLTQVAGSDASHGLLVERVGTRLEIDEEYEFFLRCELSRLADAQTARHVDGDRLGEEDVLAGFHRGRGLLGVEVGGRFDDHGVDIIFDDFTVARQSRVSPGRFDPHPTANGVDAILEVIADGREPVPPVGEEQVGEPPPAPSTADEPQGDLRVGVRAANGGRSDDSDRGRGGGEEGATADLVGAVCGCHLVPPGGVCLFCIAADGLDHLGIRMGSFTSHRIQA